MLTASVIPGNPVRVACDLSSAQIAACTHALVIHRAGRFRLAEMSVDDTLALRDLTGLIDRFEILQSHGAHDTVQFTAGHLVQVSDVVRDFVVAQGEVDTVHPESRPHLATAAGLVDPLADLAAEALRVAMDGLPEVVIDDSDFDALLDDSRGRGA